jgi:hypothetical protein
MKIWSVDLVTETFSEQIDVQGLESWTDQVTDLAGVSLLLLKAMLAIQFETRTHLLTPLRYYSIHFHRLPLTRSTVLFTSYPRKAKWCYSQP